VVVRVGGRAWLGQGERPAIEELPVGAHGDQHGGVVVFDHTDDRTSPGHDLGTMPFFEPPWRSSSS
jgi:hypothetical protein